MTKLTKETINYLLQPGMLFQSDGTILAMGRLTREDLENASAAYRVGFLHEDIDTVLKEVNAKRGFVLEDETDSGDDVNHH